MDTGTVVIIVIAAVIVVAVFAVLITLRVRAARMARRSRQEQTSQTRQQNAVWAGALIVDSHGGEAGEGSGQVRLSLVMEVTPSEGAPYRTSAVWMVDMTALHLASSGSHVPVKLDPADTQTVYPAVPWARYISR